jgi:hypothetical protein
MPAQFIDAHHAGLGVTKRLPASALRHLSGWTPVHPEELAPDVSASTVATVLAEVGSDPVKAAAALEAETARNNPRSTLVDALNRIIDEES